MILKNSGTKKIARKVAASIPPITPVPTDWRAPAPAPVEIASGSTPRMKASEVIRIGRNRSRAASSAAAEVDMPCAVLEHRELDDQDRVLGGEPEQRHQADLEVDVVGEAAQPDGRHRAEGAEGQGDQHRQRQRPALVLRRQDQEHHHRREADREAGGAARALLLERRAAPVVAEVGGQHFPGDRLDPLDRLARSSRRARSARRS